MENMKLPDKIKLKIGTIKTDICELKYEAGFHLAAGVSFFYAAAESSKSFTQAAFSMLGATTLALSANIIDKIQEKKRDIEEYEQGEYIQINTDVDEEKHQLEMAKSNLKLHTLGTIVGGGLLCIGSLALTYATESESMIPALILAGGTTSLEGYKVLREKKMIKQLEKSTTSRGSK